VPAPGTAVERFSWTRPGPAKHRRSTEEFEQAVSLPFQRAGWVAGTGRAAGPQHDQPEQCRKTPEVMNPAGLATMT
jgi:hypothetical protein